jgi:TM2 domain-containing membrane protein YozV
MNTCAACGKELRPGAAFCGGCGASVSPAVAQTAITSIPPTPPQPPAQMQAATAYQPPTTYAPPPGAPYAAPPPQAYGTAPYGQAGAMPPGTSLAALCQAGRLMSWNGRPLPPTFASRKVAAGVLGILFGQLGIHKFVLGYVGSGIAMLLITLISIPLSAILIGFFGIAAMSIIGLIEGILYLTRSDEEFIQRYGVNHKSWF